MKRPRKELKEYKKTKILVNKLYEKIEGLIKKGITDNMLQELVLFKDKNERRIKRVNNALSILDDMEREILIFICVEHNSRAKAVEKFGLSESRLSQIEGIALDKMSRYII